MNILNTIKTSFKRWDDYKGRSTRKEFWIFVAYAFLIYLIYIFLVYLTAKIKVLFIITSLLFVLLSLVNFFVYLSLMVRRLHDMNASGWSLLAIWGIGTLINLANFVPLSILYFVSVQLIWLVPGTEGKNKYGSEHKLK